MTLISALLAGVTAVSAQQSFSFDGEKFTNKPFPAGTETRSRRVMVERYNPTIWVDPDGCEHWVMDDGFEGFMTNHLDRDGKPVCREARSCASFPGDALFASNDARLNPDAKDRLADFFTEDTTIHSYVVTGHTDSRASDAYNIELSKARAKVVAEVALGLGARIHAVRAAGERQPKASNATPQGRATNRRVEIMCVR